MNWASHYLFREDAVPKWALAEPIDGLARVDLPNERTVAAALAVGIVAVALWSVVGSVERNLWLTSVFADGGPSVLKVTTHLHPRDAEHLLIGASGDIIDPTGQARPAVGVVTDIVPATDSQSPVAVVWRIADPSPWMAVGEDCGLRVPMGRARPVELIIDVLR